MQAIGIKGLSSSLLFSCWGILSNFSIVYGKPQFKIPPRISERIITELQDVLYGVALDFSYNETLTSGRLSSSPGCPKSVDGYPWVYVGKPPKCYLAGERGPCAYNERIFVSPDSPKGFCNCKCFEGRKRSEGNQVQFCLDEFGITEFAFVPKRKKCFVIHHQGLCPDGEWTEKDEEFGVRCKKRKCGEDERAIEINGKVECKPPFFASLNPTYIPPNQCASHGMKFSVLLKKCVKPFSFQF